MAFKLRGFSGFKNKDDKMMTASGEVVDKKTAKNLGKDMMRDKLADDQAKITESLKDKYTTAGTPESLFNADGKKINTNNIDEGNLSKIKVESGTKRKYVEYVEGPKAGGRLYLSKR